ncbi:cytochrome C oxidase Cbb3 [Paenalcaligenes hominis]|uniref:Cytochrome C oxidase Cbb3 n=1 Tax=Paenalcaligenes hominis TaxID=643674 RepID=A0A1U9K2J3_9BURK|nr:cytochrome c [Paenalcaligenes hominis]AQS52222.1 cytochrome C oxidase Cbb3 [Paenalcaligenes hominis]
MLTRKQGIAGIVITLFVGSGLLYLNPWQSDSPFIDPADQSLVLQGKKIYATNCASCHGANLEGQSNWRQRLPNGRLPAPPHDVTGHTWHHADSLLIDIVKNGLIPGRTAPPGYQSDMPAYGSVLSDEEIRAVLAYIKSSWPLQALQAQKDMTLKQNH